VGLFLLCVLCVSAVFLPAQQPELGLLERLEQLRQVARELGSELWPGWDPAATPLAIYKGSEMVVLVGHPAPPAGFTRLQTQAVSAPVFVAGAATGFLRANTAQVFAGALTSFFSYSEFMSRPLPEALALGIHELFHAQQNRIAPRKFGDILVVLWGKYPEFSPRNRALLAMEAELLHRALTATDAGEARGLVAGFLGIRAERRKELGPELARYESGEESSEGLARYIEFHLLELLAQKDARFQEAGQAAAKRLEPLKNIHALQRDRERFYALGLSQAALLDRFRPGWKREFESGPLLLDELLAGAVPAATPAETARWMDRLSFPRLLAEQEKAVAERLEQGQARLTVLASRPGERVVIEVGALKDKIVLRGFNPNGSMALDPDRVLHTFLLLDLGAQPGTLMRMEFRGLPALYDRSLDAFWCMLPSEAVARALQAYAQAPAPDRLLLKAEGFSGEFTGVQVERRARELRIRPAEELKRAPLPAKPEFVRPGKP